MPKVIWRQLVGVAMLGCAGLASGQDGAVPAYPRPRDQVAADLFGQLDLAQPHLAAIAARVREGQPGEALDLWRDQVVARLRTHDFGEYGWHDYARHPRNTGMIDALAGVRTRQDYLTSNLVGFVDIYGLSGAPGSGKPITWFVDVDQVTDWGGNAELAGRRRDQKLLCTAYGNFEFAKSFVARYWETGNDVYLRKGLEIMADFAVRHQSSFWAAYAARGGTTDKEVEEFYRCDWRLNTNGLEVGWRLKNFLKVLAGLAKSLGADKPKEWAGVLHPVPGALAPAEMARIPADQLAEIALSLLRHHASKLLWFCVRDGAVPNQRAEGLKALAMLAAIFPDFKATPQVAQYTELGYRSFLATNFLPDGGSLEPSFNYNGQDKEGLEELVRFCGDPPPPFAPLALAKVKARRLVDDGLQTPLGSLPQVGNWHHTLGKNVWASDAAARQYWDTPLEGKTAPRPQPYLSTAFLYSGFYAMRSGWGMKDLYLFFMNGRPQSGHSMRDNGAIQVFAYGRPLVVCGGPPTYGMFKNEEARGADFYLSEASSLKVNTVLVDGLSQAKNAPPADRAYETPVPGRWHTSPAFDLVDGLYDLGYAARHLYEHKADKNINMAVTHYRRVVFVRAARLWLIEDRLAATDNKPHEYTQVWNFLPDSPDPDYTRTIAGFKPDQFDLDPAAKRFRTADPSGPNVEFLHFGPPLAYRKYCGNREPWLGWFAAGLGDARPKVDVHAAWASQDGDTLLTLLIPLDKGQPTPIASAVGVAATTAAGPGLNATLTDSTCLSYRSGTLRHALDLDGVRTAAESLLVVTAPDGRLAGIVTGCGELTVRGKPVTLPASDFEFALAADGTVQTRPFFLPDVPRIDPPRPFLNFSELPPLGIAGARPGLDIRCTLDASDPVAASPVYQAPVPVTAEGTLKARFFQGAEPLPLVATRTVARWPWLPRAPDRIEATGLAPGLDYGYVEHEDSIRLYDLMLRPMLKTGVCADISLAPYAAQPRYGLRWRGYLRVPTTGMYHFTMATPVYAYLFIRDEARELQLPPVAMPNYDRKQDTGSVALEAGFHSLEVQFIRAWKAENRLTVEVEGPGLPRQALPAAWLFRRAAGGG